VNIGDFPPLDLGQMKNSPSYEDLQALCARAADAMEEVGAYDGATLNGRKHLELIAELRKAAE